ncbi:MAG TPA: transporter [Burkholderiales bacterium]|nr:transporter [Burkholderiales bacterium]
MWKLAGYSSIPIAALIVSGFLATMHTPGPVTRSAILHFAAGLVLAVVAVEFLPDLLHQHSAWVTALGFSLGTVAMLLIRAAAEPSEIAAEQGAGIPRALLFATGVDLIIDGLMLGIGFAAGQKEGILLTVALAIELAALGIATVATLTTRQISRGKILLIIAGLALLFGVSAVAGGLPLQRLSGHAMAGVLAFGSAALLFLVTEELLIEAHEVPESPWLTATFFLGFLVLLLLELLN